MRQPRPFLRAQTNSYYVKLDGRFVSLGKDKQEAWAKYYRLMAERGISQPGADERTVCQLLDLYWTHHVQVRCRPSTAVRRKPILKSFGEFVGPRLTARELKPYHVTEWINGRHASVSDTRKNTLITTIKGALNWAEQQGYIDRNPIAKMKKPPVAIRQEFLPNEKWIPLIEQLTGSFRDLVVFMLDTGARAEEIYKLEAQHYDAKNNRFVLPITESKGRRTNRVIWLPETATEIVRRLIRQNPEGGLFRDAHGKPFNNNSVRLRFARIKKKLGLAHLCATMLRHSFAHYRLTSGQDVLTVAKLLGHVDTRMLATRYGHLEANHAFMAEQAKKISFPAQ